jgi:HSP20 family protein
MSRLSRVWDPWRELDQIRREVNRVFSDWPHVTFGAETEYPPISAWHNEHEMILTAEIPGLDADGVDLSVTPNSVTLRGERQPDALKDGQTYYRRERQGSSFSRTVELPFEVDPKQTEATYDRGVLKLTLHRPEEQKPRKITVTPN